VELQIADFVRPSTCVRDWSIPEPRTTLPPACLTDLLAQSPELQKALLPKSRGTITLLNKALNQAPLIAPSETTRTRQLYSRVALTVDRAALFIAGCNVWSEPLTYLRSRNDNHARALWKVIHGFKPPTTRAKLDKACLAWLFALGGIEPVMRGFRPLSDVELGVVPRRLSPETAAQCLADVLSDDVAEEIAALVTALRAIRPRGRVRPNPAFGGTGAVLGSDGDWIAGDTLVELKCVVAGVERQHVAQLLCYYAFDRINARTGGGYGFCKLALVLPRQATTIIGAVDEWLASFGGPAADLMVPEVKRYFDKLWELFVARQVGKKR
jgi:hypothetical protein